MSDYYSFSLPYLPSFQPPSLAAFIPKQKQTKKNYQKIKQPTKPNKTNVQHLLCLSQLAASTLSSSSTFVARYFSLA